MADPSVNVYRIPYVSGTKVRVTGDHLTHSTAIDMHGTGGTPPYRIVAAADGVVRFIEDGFSENRPDGNPCNNNYVWMQSGEEMHKYSHFRQNSIRGDAGLTEGQTITAGTFLGFESDVGCAHGVHLHFEVALPIDPADPIDEEGFIQGGPARRRIPRICGISDQTFVDGQTYIAGTSLSRLDTAVAGKVGQTELHFVRSRRVVSAVQDAEGNLKLIVWGMGTNGAFTRRGDAVAGSASEIALAEPRPDLLVTACRDGDGNLRLISWLVTANGELDRCFTATAGAVSRVAMASDRQGSVVTAVRDSEGDLKLIAWSVSSTGQFTRRGDASAGAVSRISIVRCQACSGVLTAVRTGSGDLKLIAWTVSADGQITRRGSAEAGAISAVSLVARGASSQFPVVAMRDGDGNLRLVSWLVMAGGGTIQRRDTAMAGAVSEVNIARVPSTSTSVVACRDGDNHLRLISWDLAQDGSLLTRCGTEVAGSARRISCAGTRDEERDFVITACADSDDNLRLISWSVNAG